MSSAPVLTGHPQVDAALARIADLDDATPGSRYEALAAAHETLALALNSLVDVSDGAVPRPR